MLGVWKVKMQKFILVSCPKTCNTMIQPAIKPRPLKDDFQSILHSLSTPMFIHIPTYIYYLVRQVSLRQPKGWCGPARNLITIYLHIYTCTNLNIQKFTPSEKKNIENLFVLMLSHRPPFRFHYTDSPKFWDTLTFLTTASPFLNFGNVIFICSSSSAFFRHSLCRLKLKCTAARMWLWGNTHICCKCFAKSHNP